LLQKGRVRHALFFTHLAVEKALKALACRQTKDLAPRTHNLVRLAEVAGLALGHDRLRVLARLNEFCQAGRYPEVPGRLPSVEEAEVRVAEVREVFLWLMSE
jgi:HEPN domain-containing protein